MSARSASRGFTIIEAMCAMAVLFVGVAGVASLQTMGSRMNGDARVMTRASAIGQDLVEQIHSWDYFNDPRLENVNTGNDADFADGEAAFEGPLSATLYDHAEAELEASPWYGIPTADVEALGFERYWNVAPYLDPETGSELGLKVAVIVRWDRGGAPRRIVFTTYVRDPGVTIN